MPILALARPLILIVAALGFLILIGALYRLGRITEPHHGYWGALGLAALWEFWPLWGVGLTLLAMLFLWWIWDDALQHHAEHGGPETAAQDHSFWHELYSRTLWRWIRI